MATATKKTVEVPVTTITREERVILELSVDEARFLRDVLAAVGGHPTNSRRRHEPPVSRALASAGISYIWTDQLGDIGGSVRFRDDR